MGTRSAIAVSHNGIIKAVYCHWDGYIEHNGKILYENYDSVKANKLVALGSLSILAARIEPTTDAHTFDTTEDGVCVFYGRDRNEEGMEFQTFQTKKRYLTEMAHSGCEYFYLMEDGKWKVSNGSTWKDLASFFELEEGPSLEERMDDVNKAARAFYAALRNVEGTDDIITSVKASLEQLEEQLTKEAA